MDCNPHSPIQQYSLYMLTDYGLQKNWGKILRDFFRSRLEIIFNNAKKNISL